MAFPLHHGGVFTAPRWSFDGTMVEWHRHRGVFPDFTMVKIFLHHGEISKKCGSSQSPWWRPLDFGLETVPPNDEVIQKNAGETLPCGRNFGIQAGNSSPETWETFASPHPAMPGRRHKPSTDGERVPKTDLFHPITTHPRVGTLDVVHRRISDGRSH